MTTMMTSILFLKLAKKWPNLATSWQTMERELVTRYPRNKSKITLALRFKIISGIIMTLAFGKICITRKQL